MKRVLVVDDNHEILEVLTLILEMEGYEVKSCDNGQNVVNSVYEFSPHLILLDIMLNGIDGREVCRNLKNTPQTSYIPIIMISASHNSYNLNGKGCDADDFISKPFDIEYLVGKVEEYVGGDDQRSGGLVTR